MATALGGMGTGVMGGAQLSMMIAGMIKAFRGVMQSNEYKHDVKKVRHWASVCLDQNLKKYLNLNSSVALPPTALKKGIYSAFYCLFTNLSEC